jgi:molecular chaperone GrpE
VPTEEQNQQSTTDQQSAGQDSPERDSSPEQEGSTEQTDKPVEVESVSEQTEATGAENPLQAEVDDLKGKLLLAQADMQNLRRRAERDVENAHKFALDKFVGDLISVVDNLERATAAIDVDNESMKALAEGVELTLKSLLDVLRRHKVEPVDPTGEQFDPEKHQAMTMVPNPDVAPNTVLEVFQKGYLLNGRLVRPAMVVVCQGAG